MIVTASITIYAVPTPQPATYTDVICQPDAVSVDCNNVQSLPLGVKVVKRVGGALEEQKAYVRIRVFAGEVELGVADSGVKVSEWGYFLPADKWGNADMLAVEVHGNAGYTDLLAEKKVGILRQNAVPFPIEGEWKPLPFKYKNGEYFIDPVHNLVFQWGNPVPGNSEMHPFEDMKQHPQETSWRKYSDWALLATQVFLANWAKLGSAVFSGDHMMSQHGRNAAGEADSDYRKFDAEKLGQPDCPFTPNVLINWLTGRIEALEMIIKGNSVFGGHLEGTEGTFKRLECTDGQGRKIVLDPSPDGVDKPSVSLYDAEGKKVCNVSFDDKLTRSATIELFRYDSLGNETNSCLLHSNGIVKGTMPGKSFTLTPDGLTYNRVIDGVEKAWLTYPADHKVVARSGGDYHVGVNDYFIRTINGTNYVYLPDASTCPGRVIYFKKTSGGDYTYLKVDNRVNGGIKDENNSTSVKQYEINQNVALFVVSDATDWIVFYCG